MLIMQKAFSNEIKIKNLPFNDKSHILLRINIRILIGHNIH